ncbi:hypothetical protein GWK47_048488 [Chionoecetes opilio]|uniref:Uncharacterized protein n=1 Tax=Chionoecetes opilio TaxID=41210 RepID=A0A8J5CFQ4_CHIOP|nr:hypothetical protein GWK47_048488 [Chionoecetes opilio]
MAGLASRTVARLLTSIHTTPALQSAPTRTILSFKGLQSLAQPGMIASEEVEQTGFMRQHLDALSFWYDEAEKMSEARILPFTQEPNLLETQAEQIVELLEDLVDSNVLDAHQHNGRSRLPHCRSPPHIHPHHPDAAICPHQNHTELQGTSEPRTAGNGKPPSPHSIASEEVEQTGFMRQHLDALSFWYDEAEKMSEARILPFTQEPNLLETQAEQIVELLEDLVDSNVLDARTGWPAESQ